MEKYYLILSEGEYSDYDPVYFVGGKQITQDQLNKKGEETGDCLYQKLSECTVRIHDREACSKKYYGIQCNHEETEAYWQDTGEQAHSYQLAEMWFKEMEKWIKEQGFENLPTDIPEINVAYSEIPHTKQFEEPSAAYQPSLII